MGQQNSSQTGLEGASARQEPHTDPTKPGGACARYTRRPGDVRTTKQKSDQDDANANERVLAFSVERLMVTPVESAAHHAARVATVSAASSASTSSPLGTIALFLACIVLFGCCCVCALLQVRAYQRRRHEEERQPLIEPQYDPYGSPAGGSRGRGADMAAIGTPARDFVRLSSLPPSALRMDEHGRRCMACSAENECVALRPCGHVVLCRACSDFVYTCPFCGQYISGISTRPNPPGGANGNAAANVGGIVVRESSHDRNV